MLTNTDDGRRRVKGYVWLTDVVASSHALHRLHHVCVGPGAPAGVVVPLVAHRHLDAGQHAAGEHRSHAGQSETGADSQTRVLVFFIKSRLRHQTDQV